MFDYLALSSTACGQDTPLAPAEDEGHVAGDNDNEELVT